MSNDKPSKEALDELIAEKAKQGYRLDRVDWKTGEIHFKEWYPGAADKARERNGG